MSLSAFGSDNIVLIVVYFCIILIIILDTLYYLYILDSIIAPGAAYCSEEQCSLGRAWAASRMGLVLGQGVGAVLAVAMSNLLSTSVFSLASRAFLSLPF